MFDGWAWHGEAQFFHGIALETCLNDILFILVYPCARLNDRPRFEVSSFYANVIYSGMEIGFSFGSIGSRLLK